MAKYSLSGGGTSGSSGSKYSLNKDTSKKGAKEDKAFLGINLPAIGIGGHNLVDLPAIGVHTSKHNPVTQVEDLVTGFPAGLMRLAAGIEKETDPVNFGGFSKEKTPTLHALVSSPIRTIKTLNPYDLGYKGGTEGFSKTELGKRVKEEGVLGTGLATAADLSLLAAGAGAAGKALGLGDLAKAGELEQAANASSKAAGLGKVADVTKLTEEATRAAGKGLVQDAVDLQRAADQLREAQTIRATETRLGAKATEKAVQASKFGAELGNVPAKPYQLLGKGLAKIPEGIGTAVENATERNLPGSKLAEKAVQGVSNVVKYAGDKAKIADLYYRNVTAPTQEALFRRLERGESVEAIRADLVGRYPGSEQVFDKMAADLQNRVDNVNAMRPRGEAERMVGVRREIASKSPEEWGAELDTAQAKLTQAKTGLSALPDGDPKYKAASKAVTEAKKDVNRLNAMRKMSMVSGAEPEVALPKEAVPEPKASTAVDEAVPDAGTPGGPSFEEMNTFNKENIKAVRAEFHNQIQQSFAPGLTAEGVLPDMQLPKGHGIDVGEVLKARGYTAWDPVTGAELKGAQIKPTSAVLPTQAYDEVARYSKYNAFDKANSKLLQAYDYATGKWKHTVLALSPRWHVGNILGNIAMAGAAGVSPLEVIKLGPQAWGMVKEGTAPAELLSSGFHFSEEAFRSITSEPLSGAKEFAKHPIQASYQMNQFVDDVNRTLIYLSKKQTGISDRAAIQAALKGAGDFSRMTPFERNVVRRAMPFYAWQKHITKLTFRLPLEDPARVAWTLHLADMGEQNNPDAGATGFNKNTVPIPGGLRLNLDPLNPFSSSIGMGLGKDTVTRAANPLIGLGLAATTGASTKRGLEGVTMPERQFGEAPKPLIGMPQELARYVAQQVPFTRQLQDLAAGQTKTRLDTGQESKAQYPEDAQNRWQQLLKFIGIGVRPDLKGQPSKKVTSQKVGAKGGAKYSLKK